MRSDPPPHSPADTLTATAYWTVAPGRGELREQPLAPPGPGEALVRARHSGISRGTEMLVHRGGVPAGVAAQMRAPFQAGELPGPVKYGYLSVGVVESVTEAGSENGETRDLLHRDVFCLFPHQDRYVVPVSALSVVPDGVPPARAVLAGTVETALNAVWDAAPRMGDRIAVVGAGMVGAAVTALLRTFPLERLQMVDVDESRRAVAERLGVEFVGPGEAAEGCDVVVHCSATGAGLNRGLELLGDEGELVEVSWYGDRAVTIDLGAQFHARRLSIRASQVGAVAVSRRARRTYAERMAQALDRLRDPALDALISGHTPFRELPGTMDRLAAGEPGLCHVVDY